MRTCLPAILLFPFSLVFQVGPMPDAEALRLRAIATADRTAADREKYECRERQTQQDLDGSGRVKKKTSIEREFFFVYGRPIFREVMHDDKPLSSSDQKKQDERVRKEVGDVQKEFQKGKRVNGSPLASRNFLKMARLGNERRILVSGRPTIVFDVLDDTEKKSFDLTEKIIAAMRGTLSLDEESGQVQDLNVVGVRDVKIGGGLLANIHKGFTMHVVFAPEKDGVWMLKTMWGSGDARVGLFLHPVANFRTDVLGCHLFNVTTDQVVKGVDAKP